MVCVLFTYGVMYGVVSYRWQLVQQGGPYARLWQGHSPCGAAWGGIFLGAIPGPSIVAAGEQFVGVRPCGCQGRGAAAAICCASKCFSRVVEQAGNGCVFSAMQRRSALTHCRYVGCCCLRVAIWKGGVAEGMAVSIPLLCPHGAASAHTTVPCVCAVG